jgi:iron complex outermembrane receptor protein
MCSVVAIARRRLGRRPRRILSMYALNQAMAGLMVMLLALALMADGAFAQSPDADPDPADSDIEEFAEEGEDEEFGVYDDGATDEALDAASNMEEITITGKATGGSTQAAPEAITTFDQEQLDVMGITDVDSLALNTPSLHVGQFGANAVITLRGVGVENLTSIGEPGVTFEVNGIHMGRPSAANASFYDVEAVNVLRGPQGQMGGKQSTGGRIAYRNKRPSIDPDFFGDFQYGAYDQFRFRTAGNMPLWDEYLMSRLTVTYENRDGYQDNYFTGRKSDNADDANNFTSLLQLRSLLLDESIELLGIGDYSFQKGNGPARHLLGNPDFFATDSYLQGSPRPIPANYGGRDMFQFTRNCTPDIFPASSFKPAWPNLPFIPDEGTNCVTGDPRATWTDIVSDQDNSQYGFTGHAGWDLPFFSDSSFFSDMHIHAVGGYHATDQNAVFDPDGVNAPGSVFKNETEARQSSIEVYIERPDVDNFDFKTGFFYFNEGVDTDLCFNTAGTRTTGDVRAIQDLENESLAWYGSAGYRLLDNLKLHAGVRYSVERKAVTQYNERYASATLPSDPKLSTGCGTILHDYLNVNTQVSGVKISPLTSIESERAEWTNWSPAAGFDWEITDFNTMSFNYSSGFKAGGFPLGSGGNILEAFRQPYDPELVDEWELTFKNQFFDSRLQANLTFFWTEYEPFQVCQITGALYWCQSDGTARNRGIELEIVAEPVDNLQLNGHFNFLDARIVEFDIVDPTIREDCGRPVCGPAVVNPPADVSGNQLPKAPVIGGSFGIQYAAEAGRWGTFTPRAQVQGQTRTYYRVFNRDEFSQEGFAKLDLQMSWLSEDGRFQLVGFVNNVTDVDVLNFLFVGAATNGSPVLGQYLAPRTWGIRLGINYTSDLF